MLTTISTPPLLAAFASSADVGFQDGVSDCQSGTSNAINGHSNAGHHSAAYMDAYNRGLSSCGGGPTSSSQPSTTSTSGGNTNQGCNDTCKQQCADFENGLGLFAGPAKPITDFFAGLCKR